MGHMYQVVLQFQTEDGITFDALLDLEDSLRVILPKADLVDGHDAGCGEMNIFIHSEEPDRILRQCLPVLNAKGLESMVRAGYRKFSEEGYRPIWPVGDISPFEVQ